MTNIVTVQSAHELITKLKPQMSTALPKHLNADRLARIALTEIRRVPKLLQCSQESFMKCLMVSAQLGLEPGLLGHVYFIPYGNEAQMIIGYKGMLDLARRSGQIASIEARVVHEKDHCEIRLGCDSGIEHTIDPRCKDRGEVIGYYAIAKLVGGGVQFEFMTDEEIEKVRQSSKAGKSGPWVTHREEMAKKTVIRRLFKYLPVSVELQRVDSLEVAADTGSQKDIIETEFFEVDQETGEIISGDIPTNQAETLANKIK